MEGATETFSIYLSHWKKRLDVVSLSKSCLTAHLMYQLTSWTLLSSAPSDGNPRWRLRMESVRCGRPYRKSTPVTSGVRRKNKTRPAIIGPYAARDRRGRLHRLQLRAVD